MYLSPKDAHHIYSPVSGRIVKTVHIPGALWPVNDWALHSIDGLFAVNERVITFIESQFGLVAVVMIGATNVGKISLAYTALETNVRPWKKKSVQTIRHSPAVSVACGDKIGTFKMGSSVILITENRRAPQSVPQFPQAVHYGAALYGGR
jgi:phosphatidylserine decarboxylase